MLRKSLRFQGLSFMTCRVEVAGILQVYLVMVGIKGFLEGN